MFMASSLSTTLVTFKVKRQDPEIIGPSKPTPHEFKYLSDIDDQESLRYQLPVIQFYRKHDVCLASGKDPVEVIRKAIANTLVFYYPFAGRLVEAPGRKLVVECNGKGVMFIEADADVRLDEFGDALRLHPPFPCLEELIFDVPGSGGVLNCPLLLIQVTRLQCGGFILAIRLNHTMSDAYGLVQFMTALGEISRGIVSPSILPVWQRHILNARDPPQPTFSHREYDVVPDTKNTLVPLDDMVQRSFFFGPQEVASLRKHMPFQCSTFEMLTACLWRCRTIAISPDPEEEVRMICTSNVRGKFNPPIPKGYYGNTIAFPVAISTAEKLCNSPLGYALELVKKARREVMDEYMRSLADFLVKNGRPHVAVVRAYGVSDVTRVGTADIDFGWGKAIYSGPAEGGVGAMPGLGSFYISFKNNKGEDGILVPICLDKSAMTKFVVEIEKLISSEPYVDSETPMSQKFITSAL